MTPTRYLFFRMVSHIGYKRKNTRLGQAAAESQLLKEAETFLGQAIWQKVENIEALSMEYWNLRNMITQHDQISNQTDHLIGKLNESHQLQDEDWIEASKSLQDLNEERNKILAMLDVLGKERDRVVVEAHEIRRHYDGLKLKQEVLSRENGSKDEISKTFTRLAEIRGEFDKLKQEREQIAKQSAAANLRLQEIEALTAEQKLHGKTKMTGRSQFLGDANQQISSKLAQLNSLNAKMIALYWEIGRHVSINYRSDPACKKAGKGQGGLISVIAALRRSIQYNLNLASRG